MAAPAFLGLRLRTVKRFKRMPHFSQTATSPLSTSAPYTATSKHPPSLSQSIEEHEPRLPRTIQAVYLKPLKRQAQLGLPVCDLQMRSYSVRNLEFFADFALRAAYYLHLSASGPSPLPRITERWTVPRSVFVHKKSQENFERITLRRLIQIKDGHPETVEVWLAYLRKHAFYGIGMKANVWRYDRLGVSKSMDLNLEEMKTILERKLAHFGRSGPTQELESPDTATELISSEKYRGAVNEPLIDRRSKLRRLDTRNTLKELLTGYKASQGDKDSNTSDRITQVEGVNKDL